MQANGLRIAVLLALVCAAPLAAADTATYRVLPPPPLAPAPPAPIVPTPPIPPCSLAGFVLDCTSGGTWATGLPGWAEAYGDQAGAWPDAAIGWAEGPLADWALAPDVLLQDQFTFLGPAGTTQATVHVHDALVDSSAVFVVKGGPAGEMWVCKHTCTVPDSGFTVSVDPLDVPPNVWLGFDSDFPLPNLPAVAGTITVTFA